MGQSHTLITRQDSTFQRIRSGTEYSSPPVVLPETQGKVYLDRNKLLRPFLLRQELHHFRRTGMDAAGGRQYLHSRDRGPVLPEIRCPLHSEPGKPQIRICQDGSQ